MGELIHQAEIARRLGVTRQYISFVARRDKKFPAVVTDGRYNWDEVKAWRFRRSEPFKESCA
jgi:hypothetical protein